MNENKYIPYHESNYFDMPCSDCYRNPCNHQNFPMQKCNNNCQINPMMFIIGYLFGNKLK